MARLATLDQVISANCSFRFALIVVTAYLLHHNCVCWYKRINWKSK